jgi:hypothetical protein
MRWVKGGGSSAVERGAEHTPPAEARELIAPTGVEFTLPRGYADEFGNLHRQGSMRLATALDEVQLLQDPRVHANQAYVSILLLSRVLTRLGDISPVPPPVVERLFSVDFAYLQDLYVRLNTVANVAETECPACGTSFEVELDLVGC